MKNTIIITILLSLLISTNAYSDVICTGESINGGLVSVELLEKEGVISVSSEESEIEVIYNNLFYAWDGHGLGIITGFWQSQTPGSNRLISIHYQHNFGQIGSVTIMTDVRATNRLTGANETFKANCTGRLKNPNPRS